MPVRFGAVNVTDHPGWMSPVLNPPVDEETVWSTWSRFTTVTVCPGRTVCVVGMNMKFEMTISACCAFAAPGVVVVGAEAGPEAQAAPTTRPSW